MNINLEYDAQALAAPQSFRDAMQTAADQLEAAFTDSITINISVGYGEYQGSAIASNISEGAAVAGSESYSSLRSQLASSATSADDNASIASLPAGSSLEGQSSFSISTAQQKAFGLLAANAPGIDGYVGMGTGFGVNLIAAAL